MIPETASDRIRDAFGEEALEGVGPRFGPGGGDKLLPESLRRSDLALTFSTAYKTITPIWMTSSFESHPSAKFGTG